MVDEVWTSTTLDQVITLQRGHDLPAQQRRPGSVPIVGSFGITGWHDSAKVAGPGVTIGRSGASIGVATYVEEAYWPLNTALYVTDFHGNDPRWVYWLLHGIDFSGYNSGSAQPSLNRNYLKGISVVRPPLEAQGRIAQVLGDLDQLIAANRKLVQALRAHSAALFREAQLHAELIIPFGKIAQLVRKRADGPSWLPYLGLEHFAADGAGIDGQGQLGDTTSQQQAFERGDILYGRLRPYFRKVDRPGFSGATSGEVWVMRPAADIPPSFLLSIVSDQAFTDFAMAGSEGTKMPRAKWDHVSRFAVRLPSRDLMAKVATVAEAEWEQIVGSIEEISQLTQIQTELAPLLMMGRIEVAERRDFG